MTQNAVLKFIDVMSVFVKSLQPESFAGTLSISITGNVADPRQYTIEVAGSGLIRVWIRVYTSPNATIPEPAAKANPYQDTNGTLVAENAACTGGTFTISSALTGSDRSVLAVAWGLFAAGSDLPSTSGTYDSAGGTTSTTTTTSTSTSTTSTTTGTTTSTTTGSTTTPPGPGLAKWTWQDTKTGPKWVLTSAVPKGSKPHEPAFVGKHIGDTAQTNCT